MKFHVSLLDVLKSEAKLKIVKFLLVHEASMSEREIASILKVSHMSVNRTMRELAEFNLVNYVSIGKAHLWKVNRNSYSYKALSEFVKGILRIKNPIEDLKDILAARLPKGYVKKVVLFGSVAAGLEKTDSDIDVFLSVKDKKDKERIQPLIDDLSSFCLESYGNRLFVYILTDREMKEKKDLKLMVEIDKGVQIFPKEKDKR